MMLNKCTILRYLHCAPKQARVKVLCSTLYLHKEVQDPSVTNQLSAYCSIKTYNTILSFIYPKIQWMSQIG